MLLSQSRQAAKDRIRADFEYDVNREGELEVAELHRKVAYLNAELQGARTALHADPGAWLDLLGPAACENHGACQACTITTSRR